MSDDISIDNLLDYIKLQEPFVSPNTLWVLFPGIEFLLSKVIHEVCSDLGCFHFLRTTQPADEVASVSAALNTFEEMEFSLNFIEKKVKSVLNFKSGFMLFPPIPPALIIVTDVTHRDLHKLMKHPKGYIVTKEMSSYFNVFEKVSLNFSCLTWLALNSMEISADPLDSYLNCKLNQIDFIIKSEVTLPSNKLHLLRKWLSTFRDIVSSCLGDSSCFEASSKHKKFVSSRKVIFSKNEDEKSDPGSITESYDSKNNKRQYEIINFKKYDNDKSAQLVTEVDRVTYQIKGKTTVTENDSILCSKSLKNLEQFSYNLTEIYPASNISANITGSEPSTSPTCLESYSKCETQTANKCESEKVNTKNFDGNTQSVVECNNSSTVTAVDCVFPQIKEETKVFEKSESDPIYLQIAYTSEDNKMNKEINHECTSTNDKQKPSVTDPGVSQTKFHPQTSIIETLDDSLGEKIKLNNTDTISKEISSNGSNKKFCKTLSNQRLSIRKEKNEKCDSIIFNANNHLNNYLKSNKREKDLIKFHDFIPQQNLIDQKTNPQQKDKFKNINVQCKSAKKELLNITRDNMYDNFEEKSSHPVSKFEVQNKAESKFGKNLNNLEKKDKLIGVRTQPFNFGENNLGYLDDEIDSDVRNFISLVKNKLNLYNDDDKPYSAKDLKDSINMKVKIEEVEQEILKNEHHINFRKDHSVMSFDVKGKNLVNEGKKVVERGKSTVNKNIVDEVVNKTKKEMNNNNKNIKEILRKKTAQNFNGSVSKCISTLIGLVDPYNIKFDIPKEVFCYMVKVEKSSGKGEKKALDTPGQDEPMEGYDHRPKVKIKEEKDFNDHPVPKTVIARNIERTDESNMTRVTKKDASNILYSNRNFEVKSEYSVKDYVEELSNISSDFMKNTEGFRNPSTSSSNPSKFNETIRVRKDLENPGSFCESYPKKEAELSDFYSYKETSPSENESISHSVNPDLTDQIFSLISKYKNLTRSAIETLEGSDSGEKDVLNQSKASVYDPFHSTSDTESDRTDTEIECEKEVGVMLKKNVSPTVKHPPKIKIETESGQETGKLLKRTAKSNVEESLKIEIKTKSNQKDGKWCQANAKSIKDYSSQSEMQTKVEKKQASYKFKVLKKEHETEINKPVPYVFHSDSEVEEENSNNHAESEKKINDSELKKVENTIPDQESVMGGFDHLYIIGEFNPLFVKNQKLLNYTFINKSVSELNECNVEDLLEEKGCMVANSMCMFLCDILDILKRNVEPKCITSKCQDQDFIVYELKKSCDSIDEGKLFISKTITSFIKIFEKFRKKLPVVVMPLQPYMLIPQFNFALNESGADYTKLFIHGTAYKWTHYRDHFVNDWIRVLLTNDKNVNKHFIESFITKAPYVYPIRKAELKGISIKNRKLNWEVKVNEVVLKLVKAEYKMKLKKPPNPVKKEEEEDNAGCSKEKSDDPDKCEIRVTNLSETVPNQFFEELSQKADKESKCKFDKDFIEIAFKSHLKGHLFENYLNNLAIGDTVLKTTFLRGGCDKDIPKLDEDSRKNFRNRLRNHFDFWKYSASELAKKKIRRTLKCESYKTIKCEQSDCDESKCLFYHSEMDRRRNPFSVPYGSFPCKFMSETGSCNKMDKCQFSHNEIECMYHPFEMHFKLCWDYKTRKDCFSSNPLCPNFHLDSPETFFTKYWNTKLLIGTPLAVEFLAGAVEKFNLFNPACKDARIFMMAASNTFLDNVQRAVSQSCKIHAVNNEFVGERDLIFECEPLLFGKPSKFVKNIGHLVLLPFTLIIVSQVDVLLSISKERKALVNFFARCRMPFAPPYVQTLFVADEPNANMESIIKHYFFKKVQLLTNPAHRIEFNYDVPCTPFTLQPLPKWLNTGANPSQVYPFLSEEVAQSVIATNKSKDKGAANVKWFRKESFYSESSESSDESSSFSMSSFSEEEERSRSKGKKRKTSRNSSSHYHKRGHSRSPSRKRSSSRGRSRRSRSPPGDLVPYGRSSSSSLSPERSPRKEKRRDDGKHSKGRSNYSPRKRRDTQDRSRGSMSPLKRRPEGCDDRNSGMEPSPSKRSFPRYSQYRSRSPPKKRPRVRDVRSRDSKSSSSLSLSPSPPPPPSPLNKLREKEKEEPKPDLPMDRIIHRSILLESATRNFNPTSLREELGEGLYEEFKASREKTVFKFEDEFNVFKTMPEMYEKYEECYEGFIQMYKIKFPKQNEEHKERLWKEFWKSKFDFIEKAELRTRMTDLIENFRDKVQSAPPAPPPPVISRMDSSCEQSKSDSRLSSYSNPLPGTSTQLNKSDFKQRFSRERIDNPSGSKMEDRQYPPPPPVISDRSLQATYYKSYNRSEISGFETRLPHSDSPGKNPDDRHTSKAYTHEKFLPPTDFEEVDQKVRKSPFLSGKGSSFDSSKRETPPIEKTHSLFPPTAVKSLPAQIIALAKGLSSDTKNKNSDESSDIIPISSSSFNTSAGMSTSFDKKSRARSPVVSPRTTSYHSKRSKETNESKLSEGEGSSKSFNLNKIIADLETMVPDIKALRTTPKDINSDNLLKTYANPEKETVSEASRIASTPHSSSNKYSDTSRRTHDTDKRSKRRSPSVSSRGTLSSSKESRDTKESKSTTMMKETKKTKVSEGESSRESFNINKAVAHMELMIPDLGVIGSSIKAILSFSKEEGIKSEKSLRNFADPDNITLIELALTKMKGKCKDSRKDFYSSLERSVKGLIKYAKEELEKREKKGFSLNYEAIANATVGKDPSAILNMIRTAAIYEGKELTKEQENDGFMEVCKIHFNLAMG